MLDRVLTATEPNWSKIGRQMLADTTSWLNKQNILKYRLYYLVYIETAYMTCI